MNDIHKHKIQQLHKLISTDEYDTGIKDIICKKKKKKINYPYNIFLMVKIILGVSLTSR